MLKRDGKVYTQIVKNCSANELIPILSEFLKESASTRTMILSMKNKYIYRSRISEKKFREILKYFAEDIEVSKISNSTKISEATLCKIFREIRILMSKECEKISKISGEISARKLT